MTIENLIEKAESLLRKKIAIKELTPNVFNAINTIDNDLKNTVNTIISLGLDSELSAEQINLINTALIGDDDRISIYQQTYRPTVNDTVGELKNISKIDFIKLMDLKDKNSKLYDELVYTYQIIKYIDYTKEGISESEIQWIKDNKSFIYSQMGQWSDGIHINDTAWYYIVEEARKYGYFYNKLDIAAKAIQDFYDIDFNVKHLLEPLPPK